LGWFATFRGERFAGRGGAIASGGLAGCAVMIGSGVTLASSAGFQTCCIADFQSADRATTDDPRN